MSGTSPQQTFNRGEPIPGYLTQELIGSGGYGEVWRAHAPGGLVKAIKIVYGGHDPRRAARELRSLNRIKQARHPFLLSIERIEIADDNLVIVTELADANLKQRFDQLLERGHRGIPRQELLSYLSDAADGLDYIYSQFSLQHLDVKPENLLLVGDRVKVADFGLAKNIYDRSVSLVEGLTPTYAPPEVFDGRPHRNSDQYSLAIVYQELLTGQLPFDGTTAAQLASQHLHAAPILTPLPKGEQPVIARALSKDPEARFPNCRTFIDQLLKLQLAEPEPAAPTPAGEAIRVGRTSPHGQLDIRGNAGDEVTARATLRIDPQRVLAQHAEFLPSDPVTEAPLAEIHVDPATVVYQPTLFLGVGGLGTRVLQKLRRRLCDRFGSLQSVPVFAMLAIDTDVRALNAVMQSGAIDPLADHETLAVPLRSPQDYRARADRLLVWLSRRWLYNIPKSLQTDGLRPLGRLALVDHAARVRARLAELLDEVTQDENVPRACRETGLNFVAGPPRVYLVASVNGATGGGMFLDLAYLVRTLLTERGWSDEDVNGILLAATPRAPQEREKALASGFAALEELWHYSRPGNCYPGEHACRIPPFHGNNRTFGSCYVLPIGQTGNEQEMDAAIDPVAEYLFSGAATPAGTFFDQARKADRPSSQPTLRTFGMCQLGGSNSPLPDQMAETLCHQLVLRWRSGEEPAEPTATLSLSRPTELLAAHHKADSRFRGLERLAQEQAASLGLDPTRMQRQVRSLLVQEMGKEPAPYFAAVIRDSLRAGTGDAIERTETLLKHVVQIIDVLLGEAGGSLEGTTQARFDSLLEVLQTRVEVQAAEMGNALRNWLFSLLDKPQLRVEGTTRAGEWFQRHIRELESRAAVVAGQIKESVFAAREMLLASSLAEATSADRRERSSPQCKQNLEAKAMEYAELRVEEVVQRAVCKWLRSCDAHVTRMLDELQELWHELNRFAGRFAEPHVAATASGDSSAPPYLQAHWQRLRQDIQRQQPQLVARLDRIAEQQLLAPLGGLRHFLTKSADMGKDLLGPLQFGARMLVICHMRNLAGQWLLGKGGEQQTIDLENLQRWVEVAIPRQFDRPDRSRLLLLLAKPLPNGEAETALAAMIGRPLIPLCTPESDLVACCEVEGIPFAPLMASLVGENPRYIELARRLHTRTDVAWQPVTGQR